MQRAARGGDGIERCSWHTQWLLGIGARTDLGLAAAEWLLRAVIGPKWGTFDISNLLKISLLAPRRSVRSLGKLLSATVSFL